MVSFAGAGALGGKAGRSGGGRLYVARALAVIQAPDTVGSRLVRQAAGNCERVQNRRAIGVVAGRARVERRRRIIGESSSGTGRVARSAPHAEQPAVAAHELTGTMLAAAGVETTIGGATEPP